MKFFFVVLRNSNTFDFFSTIFRVVKISPRCGKKVKKFCSRKVFCSTQDEKVFHLIKLFLPRHTFSWNNHFSKPEVFHRNKDFLRKFSFNVSFPYRTFVVFVSCERHSFSLWPWLGVKPRLQVERKRGFLFSGKKLGVLGEKKIELSSSPACATSESTDCCLRNHQQIHLPLSWTVNKKKNLPVNIFVTVVPRKPSLKLRRTHKQLSEQLGWGVSKKNDLAVVTWLSRLKIIWHGVQSRPWW